MLRWRLYYSVVIILLGTKWQKSLLDDDQRFNIYLFNTKEEMPFCHFPVCIVETRNNCHENKVMQNTSNESENRTGEFDNYLQCLQLPNSPNTQCIWWGTWPSLGSNNPCGGGFTPALSGCTMVFKFRAITSVFVVHFWETPIWAFHTRLSKNVLIGWVMPDWLKVQILSSFNNK